MQEIKMPIRAVPYEHQKKAFEFVLKTFDKSNGAALLIEMGCGKSLISAAVAGALFEAEKIRKLLIVCPVSICGVWQEEFSRVSIKR